MSSRKGAELRSSLAHPIVDADAHVMEHMPVFLEYLADEAGAAMVDRYLEGAMTRQYAGLGGWTTATEEERRRHGIAMPQWWAQPSNARDRATAYAPRLLHERLDELGIDFAVLYPSLGMSLLPLEDPEVRVAACRAYNRYLQTSTRAFADRLTVAAVVPMHTPEEACAGLDHAVGELGAKVVLLNGYVRRPVPGMDNQPVRVDTFGIDSDHDYDAVWRRCVELHVSPTFHSSSHGFGFQSSSSRFMYNHIGKFSAPGEASAKSLFFGGVPHRFPTLRFAWLEGGASWGAQLLVALVDRWNKRGGSNIDALDPCHVDVDEYLRLMDEYGADALTGPTGTRHEPRRAVDDTKPAIIDDFHACGVESAADIVALFDRYFFGCEADDRTTAWAFERRVNPGASAIRAMLGTDIGHWDVADADHAIPEAFELLDDGLLDADDFRAFVCDNAVLLHASANPAFFDGTPVEAYARQLLGDRGAAVA
jgi:predicted TIM-barrel fold metal-dependent hydrolase